MANRVRGGAPLKVLFVGNSFTARNDLPGLIARLAAAGGKALEHRLISAGGASLRQHWNAGEAQKAIQEGRYDAAGAYHPHHVTSPNPALAPPAAGRCRRCAKS
jgi:hypothetical protein